MASRMMGDDATRDHMPGTLAQFPAAWRRYLDADPAAEWARERLAVRGSGAVSRRDAPGGERAADVVLHPLIDAARQSEDSPQLRATLAGLARYIGLATDYAPAIMLHTLNARLETQSR
jgi:hypothetical protein